MSYTKKLLRITLFGIENNYVLVGVILLISCFLMPAFTLLTIMNNGSNVGSNENAQTVIRIYGSALAYFEGFALPLGLFSYVHKRRECDFYNSMPVRRSQYFWGYAFAGIIVFLLSFGWMCLAHFVITGFKNILPCLLQPVMMFFVIYCSMILAVCFSGSVMSALVAFTLRNAVVISVVLLPLIIAGADLSSYMNLFGKKICVFTPVTAIGAWIERWYDVMLLQLPIAVIELTAAFFLHGHRKSETTAAIAFPKSRYPFQYTVMLIAALLADALLSSIVLEVSYGYDDGGIFYGNNFYMFVFLTVIVILAVFIILNIILERTGRAAFSRIRHFFIFSACYGLILFTLFNYIAPNIPDSVLPFRPDCAIICVREHTVKKAEGEDYDYEYRSPLGTYSERVEHEGESDKEISRYIVKEISRVNEAYCVSDKQLLKKLVTLVQWGKGSQEDFYCTDYTPYDYPISNKEELDSFKKYDVYFLKGNTPYIQEGMSIFDFDDFDFTYGGKRALRCCITLNNNPVMEQFKEIRLDTKGLQLGSSSFTVVLSPDGDKMPETTKSGGSQASESYEGITWEGTDTPPETSDLIPKVPETSGLIPEVPETSGLIPEVPETSAITAEPAEITSETAQPYLNLMSKTGGVRPLPLQADF